MVPALCSGLLSSVVPAVASPSSPSFLLVVSLPNRSAAVLKVTRLGPSLVAFEFSFPTLQKVEKKSSLMMLTLAGFHKTVVKSPTSLFILLPSQNLVVKLTTLGFISCSS